MTQVLMVQKIAKDASIDQLEMGIIVKHRLKENGIYYIPELIDAIDSNKKLSHIGAASRAIIVAALSNYNTTISNNSRKKADGDNMIIKTKNSSNSSTTNTTNNKTYFNRYDMIELLYTIVKEQANDKNVPKYYIEGLSKYPSYNIFYDSEFIYFQLDYINDLMEERLKEQDIDVKTTAPYKVQSKPIFMAISYMKSNTPLYTRIFRDKQYCFSKYENILPTDKKYIRFYIDKLEAKLNCKLDLSMNANLIEEYVTFKEELKNETPININDLSWGGTDRNLAEIWANSRKYADALKITIEYTKKYVSAYKTYKGIDNDVVDKLKLYSSKIKDPKLQNTAKMLLEDIENDNMVTEIIKPSAEEPKKESVQSTRSLEEVLDKDLSRLPEDIRDDIRNEILGSDNTEKPNEYNIIITGCKSMSIVTTVGFLVSKLAYYNNKKDFNYDYTSGVCIIVNDNYDDMDIKLEKEMDVDPGILKQELKNIINN
ncbi:MAG: hypothetical protein IKR19_07610 [Acholeplasmatales bacterium]|nr:hypothetical protein [Acholeplasmatales bacterium]